MIVDLDDFGANHVISDQCQSHDCRDLLDKLHYANPKFKVTLFAIPAEMTIEMLDWCRANKTWVELAVHGWKHTDNYEASKWDENTMLGVINHPLVQEYFVKGFKAPGWQISDGCYEALLEGDWWVADQAYNNDRRLAELRAYVNYDGKFFVANDQVDAWHGHTWNCMGNGIEETFPQLLEKVKQATDFQFISELF